MVELREQNIHIRLLSLKHEEIAKCQAAINQSLNLYYTFQEDKQSLPSKKP